MIAASHNFVTTKVLTDRIFTKSKIAMTDEFTAAGKKLKNEHTKNLADYEKSRAELGRFAATAKAGVEAFYKAFCDCNDYGVKVANHGDYVAICFGSRFHKLGKVLVNGPAAFLTVDLEGKMEWASRTDWEAQEKAPSILTPTPVTTDATEAKLIEFLELAENNYLKL